MITAKLFLNGRNQAGRLPKSYRFESTEVYIKEVQEGVLLFPKDNTIWDVWERNMKKYSTLLCCFNCYLALFHLISAVRGPA